VALTPSGSRPPARPLDAISIETRRSLQLTTSSGTGLPIPLRLAETLGARRSPFPPSGAALPDDVLSFAQANNVTQIIIGKSQAHLVVRTHARLGVHDLVRRAGNISVNVIAGEELAADPVPRKTVRAAERPEPFDPRPYMMGSDCGDAWRGRSDPTAVSASRMSTSYSSRRWWSCGSLRLVAVVAGERRSVGCATTSSLADLYIHHHRPTNVAAFFSSC